MRKKDTRTLLTLAGVGAAAYYLMKRSAPPASTTARYVGYFDPRMGSQAGDPYNIGMDPSSDGSVIDFMGPGGPGTGTGYGPDPSSGPGYATPPHIIDYLPPPGGPDPSGGGDATPPHIIRGQGSHPWWRRRYGRHIQDANSSYGWGGWQPPMLSPYSGYGPSAVEMEQPGSIAAMASAIDAGAY
jgi:hypothetical protein